MAIQFTHTLPSPDEYGRLFETTGWNAIYKANPDELVQALAHSWYMVAAYDQERLIGFGRVVTDHVLHAMIYDMIVAPDYQHQGLGTQILTMLVKRCVEAGIRDIQLFCAAGKQSFYEKQGFVVRPANAPGMQYRPQAARTQP